MIEVRWGSASHQGCVRPVNEDAVIAGPDVFAVADGTGRHAGGELASAIAVAALARITDLPCAADPADRLLAALRVADAEILRRAGEDRALDGMRTTVSGIARVAGPKVLVFDLGDSRVHRLRAGLLDQLTDEEEGARHHPDRHLRCGALGAGTAIDPDIRELEVRVGDFFLVTTQGLHEALPRARIAEIVATPGTVERRARALVDAAVACGARENVSVVVVAVAATNLASGLEVDTAPTRSRSAR